MPKGPKREHHDKTVEMRKTYHYGVSYEERLGTRRRPLRELEVGAFLNRHTEY